MKSVIKNIQGNLSIEDAITARVSNICAIADRSPTYKFTAIKENGFTQVELYPIGSRETSRMVFRLALFRRRGLSESEAEKLVDALAHRDFSGDTRRSCYECSNMTRSAGCFAQQQGWIKHVAQKDVLWRCECFEFSKP